MQRTESPIATLTWHVSKYKVHQFHKRYILKKQKQKHAPQWHIYIYPPFQAHLAICTGISQNNFFLIQDCTECFNPKTGSTHKSAHLHLRLRVSCYNLFQVVAVKAVGCCYTYLMYLKSISSLSFRIRLCE